MTPFALKKIWRKDKDRLEAFFYAADDIFNDRFAWDEVSFMETNSY